MLNQKVAFRYAKALYDAAKKENMTSVVRQDIEWIANTLNSSRDLQNLVNSPIVPNWRKKEIFKELFEQKVNKITFLFVELLANKHREVYLIDIIEQFENIYNAEHNIQKVEISSARELSDSIKQKFLDKLTGSTGKSIVPTYKVDPSIKGGILVKINDKVHDFSVRNQLEIVRDILNKGGMISN